MHTLSRAFTHQYARNIGLLIKDCDLVQNKSAIWLF